MQIAAAAAEPAAPEALHIDEADVDRAMAAFDPVWNGLSPSERGRLLDLLVETVEYDGAAGKISILFRLTGIRSLAQQGENR